MKNTLKLFLIISLSLLMVSCATTTKTDNKNKVVENQKIEKSPLEKPKAKLQEKIENTSMKVTEPGKDLEIKDSKTLKDLAKEMEEYYSDPKREKQVLSDMDELSFFTECVDAGKVNISSFNEDFISEAPLFYKGNNYEIFFKDLAIYLALEKHRNCLLRNEEKVKTPIGRYYFMENLAKNKAGSFFIASVLLGYLNDHKNWCESVEKETRGREVCEKLNRNEIIVMLKEYYTITGHKLETRAGKKILTDDDLTLFIEEKIDYVAKYILNEKGLGDTWGDGSNKPDYSIWSNEEIDSLRSKAGVIESIDNLFKE